jgi:hypothetical protein
MHLGEVVEVRHRPPVIGNTAAFPTVDRVKGTV